jgi:hypothetical protein
MKLGSLDQAVGKGRLKALNIQSFRWTSFCIFYKIFEVELTNETVIIVLRKAVLHLIVFLLNET